MDKLTLEERKLLLYNVFFRRGFDSENASIAVDIIFDAIREHGGGGGGDTPGPIEPGENVAQVFNFNKELSKDAISSDELTTGLNVSSVITDEVFNTIISDFDFIKLVITDEIGTYSALFTIMNKVDENNIELIGINKNIIITKDNTNYIMKYID